MTQFFSIDYYYGNHLVQMRKIFFQKIYFLALDKLGFGDYRVPAETVLKECKSVAAKRRRQSTRLENLGIPEEELLRQQQALFAKVSLHTI
jgi:down-regulator of transcription 1